ncbi:MAG: hypothetical protein ACPG49_01545 [Chitinophagales bacterium]
MFRMRMLFGQMGDYQNDFKKGENKMKEEWLGICAKEPANEDGLH